MQKVLFFVVFAVGQIPALPLPEVPSNSWIPEKYIGTDPLDLLKGMQRYEHARLTQQVYNGVAIDAVPRKGMARKWLVPGGLENVADSDWYSEFYKNGWIVSKGRVQTQIFNGSNTQAEQKMWSVYAPGTQFADKLVNARTGKVFEVRMSEKQEDGSWHFDRIYSDWSQAPSGYQKIKLSQCANCHQQAGRGDFSDQDWYGIPLPPGSDFVFSNPLHGLER
jgi:hypothetical protein